MIERTWSDCSLVVPSAKVELDSIFGSRNVDPSLAPMRVVERGKALSVNRFVVEWVEDGA